MTDQTPASRAHRPRSRWLTVIALGAAFVAGGVTTSGLAMAAEGMAMHHHMMMGPPGEMHAMAMAHVDKMLDQVAATPDQKARIHDILKTGFAPMAGMRGDMEATHRSLHAILSAPTIDRDALEHLRASHVAGIDVANHGMTKAIADAAEVLTPDQRAKMAAIMSEHHKPS